MKNDTRRQVKLESLKHLYHLAKPGAHLWQPKALTEFIDYLLNVNDKRLLSSGLRKYLRNLSYYTKGSLYCNKHINIIKHLGLYNTLLRYRM